jgi:hypothetical protein
MPYSEFDGDEDFEGIFRLSALLHELRRKVTMVDIGTSEERIIFTLHHKLIHNPYNIQQKSSVLKEFLVYRVWITMIAAEPTTDVDLGEHIQGLLTKHAYINL